MASRALARPRQHLLARRRHREYALVWALLLPALAIFALFWILPLLWNLWLSFRYWELGKSSSSAGLDHYEEMLLFDDVFWEALWNTFKYLATAPLAILLALGLALLVDRPIRGRNL